jgi:hypothetical protein
MLQTQRSMQTTSKKSHQPIKRMTTFWHRLGYGAQTLNRMFSSHGLTRYCSRLLFFILLLAVPAAAGAASVNMAWDANNPAPDGYRIFVRSAGQAYNYSNPVWQGTVNQGSLDKLANGQTYYAVVRAFVGASQSGDSNEIEFKTPVDPVVPPVNQAPVANAGADQAVSTGTNVILNGTASLDSDGSIGAFQWTQTGGQTVALNASGTVQASFAAPNVSRSAVLTFQLKVTDNQGVSAVDTCQVTVVPVAAPDSDADGLSDADESAIYHTDPHKADTDADGVNDGAEVAAGTDPTKSNLPANTDKIWLEAEDGDVDAPMQIAADSKASEETYLWVRQGSGNRWTPASKAGKVQYTFNLSTSGTYRIWGRVLAPTKSDDSFFVSMDGGAYKVWDIQECSSWAWDLVNSLKENDPLLFKLSAGTHTLTLMQREDGTKIDRILITSDTQYFPQGHGEGQDEVPSDDDVENTILEAETGTMTLPMAAQRDTSASSGTYLWVPQGSGNWMSPSSKAGTVQYSFRLSTSGTYRIWGRILAQTGKDDSFFVSMDGGAYKIWDIQKCTSWAWDLVNSRSEGDPVSFHLSAGTHTLSLMQREDGTKIDKLVITRDATYAPQ